jgi:hypothetical protein
MGNALPDHVATERDHHQDAKKDEKCDPMRNSKDIHNTGDANVVNDELDEQRNDSTQATTST